MPNAVTPKPGRLTVSDVFYAAFGSPEARMFLHTAPPSEKATTAAPTSPLGDRAKADAPQSAPRAGLLGRIGSMAGAVKRRFASAPPAPARLAKARAAQGDLFSRADEFITELKSPSATADSIKAGFERAAKAADQLAQLGGTPEDALQGFAGRLAAASDAELGQMVTALAGASGHELRAALANRPIALQLLTGIETRVKADQDRRQHAATVAAMTTSGKAAGVDQALQEARQSITAAAPPGTVADHVHRAFSPQGSDAENAAVDSLVVARLNDLAPDERLRLLTHLPPDDLQRLWKAEALDTMPDVRQSIGQAIKQHPTLLAQEFQRIESQFLEQAASFRRRHSGSPFDADAFINDLPALAEPLRQLADMRQTYPGNVPSASQQFQTQQIQLERHILRALTPGQIDPQKLLDPTRPALFDALTFLLSPGRLKALQQRAEPPAQSGTLPPPDA
jgi:hypothetical protein